MMRSQSDRHIRVARWLSDLVSSEDRGTLAALRRGMMAEEGRLFELYGHIPVYLLRDLSSQQEEALLMVAALASFHQTSLKDEEAAQCLNLGSSLRVLGLKKVDEGTEGEAGEMPEALKRRVDALLTCHRDDLFGHLRQVISLLKSAEVPVDWAQLLTDIEAWEWQGSPVQWQWSRSFYVGHRDKEGEDANVS